MINFIKTTICSSLALGLFLPAYSLNAQESNAQESKTEATIVEENLYNAGGVGWNGQSGWPYSTIIGVKDALTEKVLGRLVIDKHTIGLDDFGGFLGRLNAALGAGRQSEIKPGGQVYISLWGSNAGGCYVEVISQFSRDTEPFDPQVILPKQYDIGIKGNVASLFPQSRKPQVWAKRYRWYRYDPNTKQDNEYEGIWYMTRVLFAVDSNIADDLMNAPETEIRTRVIYSDSNERTVLLPIGPGTAKRWKDVYSYNPTCKPPRKAETVPIENTPFTPPIASNPNASQSAIIPKQPTKSTKQNKSTSKTPANQNAKIAANQPPVRPANQRGNVALNVTQRRSFVTVSLDGAYINSPGSYTANLVVQNGGNSNFLFVPIFTEVLDGNDQVVKSKITTDSSDGFLVEPGKTLKAKLSIFGKRWNGSGSQNLSLVIKEGTTGGRSFKIPF